MTDAPKARDTEATALKPDYSGLTTEQMAAAALERLDTVIRRLERVESKLGETGTDWSLAMNYLRDVNERMGRPDVAARIEADIDAQRARRHPPPSDEDAAALTPTDRPSRAE